MFMLTNEMLEAVQIASRVSSLRQRIDRPHLCLNEKGRWIVSNSFPEAIVKNNHYWFYNAAEIWHKAYLFCIYKTNPSFKTL